MNTLVIGDGYNWIIDEIVDDYKKFTNHSMVSDNIELAWSVSMAHLPKLINLNVPRVITIHHIDPLKVKEYQNTFDIINKYAAAVICPNKITSEYAKQYIVKPIYTLPYWLLSKRKVNINESQVEHLKKEIKIDNEIIIGYFQKDSEGSTNRPKLSKGPDVFLRIAIELNKRHNIKILLSGHSRDYLIENFKRKGIKYSFYPRYSNINDLYDVCDWYLVTSRTEGGPQSILEAPYRNVKILSTRTGIAPEVLPEECLCSLPGDFVRKFEEDKIPLESIKQNIIDNFIPEVVVPKYDVLLEDIKKTSIINTVLSTVKHKNENKGTTTLKFKKDVADILTSTNFDGDILEVGSHTGNTTLLLATIAKQLHKKVVAFEISSDRIKEAKALIKLFNLEEHCTFIQKDVYKESWDVNKFGCIFIDCVHYEANVKSDLDNALKVSNNNPIIFLHDYGLLIDKDSTSYLLERMKDKFNIVRYLGEEQNWNLLSSNKTIDWEGVQIECLKSTI